MTGYFSSLNKFFHCGEGICETIFLKIDLQALTAAYKWLRYHIISKVLMVEETYHTLNIKKLILFSEEHSWTLHVQFHVAVSSHEQGWNIDYSSCSAQSLLFSLDGGLGPNLARFRGLQSARDQTGTGCKCLNTHTISLAFRSTFERATV